MTSSAARLPWIDNLRTAMICLVVCMHACVTYSHVGDWYFVSAREPSEPVKILFVFWQGHLQAFFMGLLFLLAGYFAWNSLRRHGPGRFLRERFRRLGLPILLYILVIHPFILLALNPWQHDFGPKFAWYGNYLARGEFLRSTGPLWFAFALLIFCIGFVALRSLSRTKPDSRPFIPPSSVRLLGLGASLASLTFLIRLVQPIGTNFYNFQLCFFPQYVIAFGIGAWLARRQALPALAGSKCASRAGWLGLIGGPLLLLLVIGLGGPPPKNGPAIYNGGWHWQAFGLSFWEQMTGLALGLGVLALFARKMNRETPFLRWAADRSFGVYVIHPPVLIALAMLFRPLESTAGAFAMVALLTTTGLVVSYLLSDLARRLPGLRAIL